MATLIAGPADAVDTTVATDAAITVVRHCRRTPYIYSEEDNRRDHPLYGCPGGDEDVTVIRGIDNVLFTVGDLDAAVEFYADRLGLPVAFRRDESGVALFRLGDQTPGLLVRRTGEEPRNVTGPRLWLAVADARATAVELTEAGVTLLAEPFPVATGWTVEIADPWGNVLGFTDHTTREVSV